MYMWVAFVVWTDPDACLEFVEQQNLMENHGIQCVLFEEKGVELPRFYIDKLRPRLRPDFL
tara:strand:+ start:51 stop:233 length:183 start_codon:yes stop_codon:yes gene_type:complete